MYGSIFSKQQIDYKVLLKKIDQLEIWQWLFNIYLEVDQRFCNPLRSDSSPGCWLEYKPSGWIRLQDYADRSFHNMSCFDAVMFKYGLTFGEAINYIASSFNLKNLKAPTKSGSIKKTKTIKSKAKIKTVPRNFEKVDKEFWNPLEISSKQLEDDKVTANSLIQINFHVFAADNVSYSYHFEKSIKIYQPFSIERKWFSNVSNSDIGGLENLTCSDILIITKSYKDCRVLRNLGYQSCWIQNEGMSIPDNILLQLSQMYDSIYILYDNDKAGIKAAEKIELYANILLQKEQFKAIWLPNHLLKYEYTHYFTKKNKIGVTDVADFLPIFGSLQLDSQIGELIY